MHMRFLSAVLLAAAASLGLPACAQEDPPQRFEQKLEIIGFDGMDPDLVREWMDQGRLPTFKRLADEGGLYPLDTTHSPESPTAWASSRA